VGWICRAKRRKVKTYFSPGFSQSKSLAEPDDFGLQTQSINSNKIKARETGLLFYGAMLFTFKSTSGLFVRHTWHIY
jgi:hypothetical protein